MALFELDDIFGFQQANEIRTLWAGSSAPTGPGSGEVWLDTTALPYKLKRFNGSTWDTIEGGNYILKDAADTFTGPLTSTISSGNVMLFDSGHDRITVHDGFGNFNIKSGVDETNTTTVNDGGSVIRMDETGYIKLGVSSIAMGSQFDNETNIEISNTTGINMTGKVIVYGDLNAQDQLIIPTSQPVTLTNGSIWIS
jgi:hypothetical protein